MLFYSLPSKNLRADWKISEKYKPCLQKKLQVYILAITTSKLDQIQKSKIIFFQNINVDTQLFKNVLTFDFWPSRS